MTKIQLEILFQKAGKTTMHATDSKHFALKYLNPYLIRTLLS